MAMPFMPPLYHPCSPVPPSLQLSASRPGSRHWHRYSTLSEEDWQDGGMAIPLVSLSTLPAPPPRESIAGPDFTALHSRSSRVKRRSGVMSTGADFNNLSSRQHRWSILSATADLEDPRLNGGDTLTDLPRYQTRKRKRWSNSIGSATTTVVGAMRESVVSISSEMAGPAPVSPIERDQQECPGKRREGKRRRLGRVLKGLAASFRGLGAGGMMA
ncbi:MAG: hypothetical protein LQ346_005300 [Caloplaca aetnensis]|nr:MAG: hypothetical protein LQ346_005300 [Caloplaca aetnensis]